MSLLETALRLVAALTFASVGDAPRVATAPLSGPKDSGRPRIVFLIPPLVPSADRPTERIGTVWSPNDDYDSVVVILRGAPPNGAISVVVDVVASELGPEAGGHEKRRPDRILRLKAETVQLSTLPRRKIGREILVLWPSKVSEQVGVRRDGQEWVRELRVRVRLPGGATTSAILKMQPGI